MERLAAERMFVRVVESGSFTAAAARLGTSSGLASKLVARLEAELGVKLLARTTRAVVPTEAGLAHAARLRAVIEALDEAVAAAREAAGEVCGWLRLTAPLGFGTVRLAPMLARFAAAHPGIEIEAEFSDRAANLVEEGFDAAVRIGAAADSALTGRRLGTAALVLVAAPAYLAARGRPARPEALAGHDCLIDTNFREPRVWSFAGGQRVAVAGRVTFSNAAACLTAAEAGLGIAYLPAFFAEESLAAGRVARVLEGFEAPAMAVHILYPDRRHVPARLRLLADVLVREFRE